MNKIYLKDLRTTESLQFFSFSFHAEPLTWYSGIITNVVRYFSVNEMYNETGNHV